MEKDLEWLTADGQEQVRSMLSTLKLSPVPREGETLHHFMPQASEDCLDLCQQLLAMNPSTRISAENALNHPYIIHLRDSTGENTAPSPFAWDFDHGWEPTTRALQDRVYGECVRFHPEIVARDAEWLSARGFLPNAGDGSAKSPQGVGK